MYFDMMCRRWFEGCIKEEELGRRGAGATRESENTLFELQPETPVQLERYDAG